MPEQLRFLYLGLLSVGTLVQYARPLNAMQPMLGVYIGYLLGGSSNHLLLVVSLISLCLVHSVITIWNDIEDEVGDRQSGRIYVGHWRKHATYRYVPLLGLLLLALSVGAVELMNTTTALLVLFVVLLGWVYNSKPVQASHRPVLSMAVLFLSYGLLPILVGGSIGHIDRIVIAFALFWGLNRLSLSLLKDYKDAHADAVSHKKTFLLVYGGKRTARYSFGTAYVGFVGSISVLYYVQRSLSVLFLMIVAGALLYARMELFRVRRYDQLNAVFKRCSEYQLLFEGAVIAWLITL